jgi:hypothetical protein
VTAVVLQGDARALPLPDESVDLIVTSPPYFALRSYQDDGEHYDDQIGSELTPSEFLDALLTCTEEMMRVLKRSGSIFVNLGDKYAGSGGHNNSNLGATSSKRNGSTLAGPQYSHSSEARSFAGGGGAGRRAAQRDASRRNAPDAYNKATIGGARTKSLMGLPWRYALGCIDELGLILRAEMIWSKPNGLPESVKDRVRRSHEQWFHFTKEPHYFSSTDDIRVEHSVATMVRTQPHRSPVGGSREAYPDGMNPQQVERDQMRHELGALPPSVWTIATEPLRVPEHLGIDHFAAFPTEWPRRLILGWSPLAVCDSCGQGRRSLAGGAVCECTPFTDHPPSGKSRRRPYDPIGAGKPQGSYSNKAGEYERVGPRREYHFDGWTPPSSSPGVVVDPFGGTGTTALVADALGRTGISVDLSADYSKLARWRCAESGHARKAIERTWRDRQERMAL